MTERPITLTVNGQNIETRVESRKLLSDTLRENCQLTGTHVGCEHGVCGACTVWIDGLPARSCLTLAIQMEGHEVQTIEGLGAPQQPTPLQQALHECHGLQCGFCTPGIVMTFEAFLKACPDPSEDQVRATLSGHLCRCTGYQNIVDAVLLAARRMREGQSA